jgi:hypothetical protein
MTTPGTIFAMRGSGEKRALGDLEDWMNLWRLWV